jgi:hypothetical protein
VGCGEGLSALDGSRYPRGLQFFFFQNNDLTKIPCVFEFQKVLKAKKIQNIEFLISFLELDSKAMEFRGKSLKLFKNSGGNS